MRQKFCGGMLKLTVIAFTFLVAACSSKPPDCSDGETLHLVQSIIIDNSKDMANRVDVPFRQDAKRYTDALKIEVQNIVSDGYNADAKKYSCSGTLVITTLNGMKFSGSQSFTTQATVDDKSKFVVQISDIDQLFKSLNDDLATFAMDAVEKRKP
jgi:hypothetical protein